MCNMRKYVFLVFMMLMPTFAVAQMDDEGMAPQAEVFESDVAFAAVKPEGKNLTEAQRTALLGKIERIIAKNNAGTISEHGAFGIKADIDILEKKSSAGLVRNVTVLAAEVTLTAFNTEDGSIYYSNSIRLETDVVGDDKQAMDALIKSIKVTDPQFVRFVRTARKRIAQWYNDRGLPLPIRQEKKEPEVVHDTVLVQNVYVEQHNIMMEQNITIPVTQNKSGAPSYDITISTGDIAFEILSTQVDLMRKRFTIKAKITNHTNDDRQQRRFVKAFSQDGRQLENLKVTETSSSVYEDFPQNIGVQRTFIMDDITQQTTSLSYAEFSIGGTKVVVKNLPVKTTSSY